MNRSIVINREFGSGGREIGRLICERTGAEFYDSRILQQAAAKRGVPAISVPCGKSGHLPVGFHLVGAPLSEAKLLAAGRLFEAAHGYAHQQAAL